jgi:hypothetical protein
MNFVTVSSPLANRRQLFDIGSTYDKYKNYYQMTEILLPLLFYFNLIL